MQLTTPVRAWTERSSPARATDLMASRTPSVVAWVGPATLRLARSRPSPRGSDGRVKIVGLFSRSAPPAASITPTTARVFPIMNAAQNRPASIRTRRYGEHQPHQPVYHDPPQRNSLA